MLRRLTLAVIPLVLVAGALAACAEPTRIPPAEPPGVSEPLFATDEEALAAATAAYEEYLAAVDAALADPTGFVGSFETVAAGPALQEAENAVAALVSRGLRFEGSRRIEAIELQQYFDSGESTRVIVYVCETVEGVDVLDESGESVVEPSRPDLTAFEVSVEATGSSLVVVERLLWSVQQFCSA